MTDPLLKKLESLNETELGEILEAARIALTDSEITEYVGEQMDLSNDYMTELAVKLQKAIA